MDNLKRNKMSEKKIFKRKIVLVGGPAVGKTSLIRKFVYNEFRVDYLMTIGTHVTSKQLTYPNHNNGNSIELTLMIWDIMGQKGYHLTPTNAFINAKGAILVCDLTRKDTLDDLKELIDRLFKIASNIPLIFLANKNDLVDQVQFSVTELKEIASIFDAPHFFTSAKTGENVEKAFNIIGRLILKKQDSFN